MIGIANGFLQFDPNRLIPTSSDFPVILTESKQNNRSVYPNEKFNHTENEFDFRFSALTYALPKQVTYYYKLEGYDDHWINAGNNHNAHYTNLNDGSYIFSVKAIDHTGKPSTNIASISFTITPPFWKTGWFLTLVLAMFLSML